MRYIAAGIVFDIAACLAIFLLIFLPMMVTDNPTVNKTLGGLLCESGERYEPHQIVTQDSEGTGYSLYANCVGENGERDITPKQTIYGLGAFFALLAPSILLHIIGATTLKAKRDRPREVTGQIGLNAPQSTSSWQVGTGLAADPAARTPLSFAEKLAELETAYEQRLISREEYDAMRKKVIDEAAR